MSASTQPAGRGIWLQRMAVPLLVGIVALHAGRGLLSGYSLWVDEIMTVRASLADWGALFRDWLLPDVHPPLHPVLLKIWIALAGASELATRVPSYGAVILSVVVLAVHLRQRLLLVQLLTIALYGSNPKFAYYAQETRAYGLMLLLAMVLTVQVLERRRRQLEPASLPNGPAAIAVVALLLSLSHYFGLIYVVVLIAIEMAEHRLDRLRWRPLLLLPLMGLWPVIHGTFGKLSQRSGGNFWITVEPVEGTLNNLLDGNFPLLRFSYTGVILALALAGLVVGSRQRLWRWITSPGPQLSPAADGARYLLGAIGLTTLLVLVIDLHTPISTARNLLVLLPAVTLLMGDLLSTLLRPGRPSNELRRLAVVLVVLVVIGWQWLLAGQTLAQRSAPDQNWQKLAEVLRSTRVCANGCMALGVDEPVFAHYLSGWPIRTLPIDPVQHQQAPRRPLRLAGDDPLLGLHSAWRVLPELLAAHPDRECWEPPQSSAQSIFVLLKPQPGLNLQAAGLKRCEIPTPTQP